MENILSRIAELIDRFANGHIAQFARLTGLKDAAIRAWFNRRDANLTALSLSRICHATGVSADWLLFGQSPSIDSDTKPAIRPWHVASSADLASPNRSADKPRLLRPADSHGFILTVPDDYHRMLPFIQPGSFLLVIPDSPSHAGQVLYVQNRDQSLVGRFQPLAGGKRLLCFDNPEYPPQPLEGRWLIIGIVTEVSWRL